MESEETYLRTSKRKKNVEFQGEFKKLKPPTFDSKKEEDVEAWILNMKN